MPHAGRTPPHTGRIFAGTSGWSYPSWKPGFYPKEVPARRFLEHYASRLNSVEVNYTFRSLPRPEQIAAWIAATPPHFRFSFKAPETITHRRRLRDCGGALDAFLASLAPVRDAGRLGCILFQLPPNFKPDLPRLGDFLSLPPFGAAPPPASPRIASPASEPLRFAFEFRDPAWFHDACFVLLRDRQTALCLAESEDLATPEIHLAPGFTCFRLRMAGGYDDASIARQAGNFRSLAAGGRDVYAYYKHEEEPHGPLAAESLLHRVSG